MERVRIDALVIAHKEATGNKLEYPEIAAFVFKGDKTRPLNGKQRKFDAAGRGASLISQWNNGKDLTACKPRHLIRLARLFNVTDVHELISE